MAISNLTSKPKILFAVNNGSGNSSTDFPTLIETFFEDKEDINFIIVKLSPEKIKETLRENIRTFKPQIVVAVGGDGTIKLVAETVMGSSINIGIIPAGSANGMAKELGIPLDTTAALNLILSGEAHTIHLTQINNQLCIHLSDIGFNAFLVKKFQRLDHRGMWGYLRAAWSVFWRHSKMEAKFDINNQIVKRKAVMIVVANATSYGTGITINPLGRLDDKLFEVVIIRKISIPEIIKMRLSRGTFHPQKTEVFQANNITIQSRKKVHFQIDGEYYGKVNQLIAKIVPDAVKIIY